MKEIKVRIPISLSNYIKRLAANNDLKLEEAENEIAYTYRPEFGVKYNYIFDTDNDTIIYYID